MENLTLVILAAGMGSRFGKNAGEKQITGVGPNNELLIDYAIYDAKKAGFKKIVLIIKEDQIEIFNEKIISKWQNKIDITYAIQDVSKYVVDKNSFQDRIKPWGTAHAIMCAKEQVDGNFVMINADDFYGYDAYEKIAKYMKSIKTDELKFGIVGYNLGNVISKTGEVKRGILEEKNGNLTKIIESKVAFIDKDTIHVKPLDNSKEFDVPFNTKTSLNMIGFTKEIFPILEKEFPIFLNKHKDNYLDCEYLIPEMVLYCKDKLNANVKIIDTNATWIGMTYKEELNDVKKKIKDMIDNNEYPTNLYI